MNASLLNPRVTAASLFAATLLLSTGSAPAADAIGMRGIWVDSHYIGYAQYDTALDYFHAALALGRSGELYSATTGWPAVSVTHHETSTGAKLWQTSVGVGSQNSSQGVLLRVGSDGAVLLGVNHGCPEPPALCDVDFALCKLEPTGSIVWNRTYSRLVNGPTRIETLEPGTGGAFLVGGSSGSGASVAAFDAAGTVLWTRSPGGEGSVFNGIKLDHAGHVVVGADALVGGHTNAVITQYNQAGTVLWVRNIPNSVPWSFDISPSDSIVMAIGGATRTIPSNGQGDVWQNPVGGQIAHIDSGGNTIVAGSPFVLSKFNPQGVLLWTTNDLGSVGGPNDDNYVGTDAVALKTDSAGNILVRIFHKARFSYYRWLKYRPTGEFAGLVTASPAVDLLEMPAPGTYFYAGTAPYNNSFDTRVVGAGLAIDSDNRAPLFVTQPSDLTAREGDTVSLTAEAVSGGAIRYQWFHSGIPIPNATNAALLLRGVSTPDAGDYRVAASTDSASSTSRAARLTLDPTVTAIWQAKLMPNEPAIDFNFATGPIALEVEPSGDSYLAGNSPVELLSQGSSTFSARGWVVRIEKGGSVAWRYSLGTPDIESGDLRMTGAAADGRGFFYAVGSSVRPVQGAAGQERILVMLKFGPSGLIWRQERATPPGVFREDPRSMVMGPDGHPRVLADRVSAPPSSRILEYSPEGGLLNETAVSFPVYDAFLLAPDGNLLLARKAEWPSHTNSSLIKVSLDGSTVWEREITPLASVELALDRSANITLAGIADLSYASFNAQPLLVQRWTQSGERIWSGTASTHVRPLGGVSSSISLGFDHRENLIVQGYAKTNWSYRIDDSVSKISPSGEVLWTSAGPDWLTANPSGNTTRLAVSDSGQVYVAGLVPGPPCPPFQSCAQDLFVVRYDVNGNREDLLRMPTTSWTLTAPIGGPSSVPLVKLLGDSDLFIATPFPPGTTRGPVLRRYAIASAAGAPRITASPVDHRFQPGESLTLKVKAEGSDPLSYQWRINGIPAPGGSSSTFQYLSPASIPARGITLDVKVSNLLGTLFSRAIHLVDPTLPETPTLLDLSGEVAGSDAGETPAGGLPSPESASETTQVVTWRSEEADRGVLFVAFAALAGRGYSIESRDTAGSTPWTLVREWAAQGNNWTATLGIPIGSHPGARMYRVVLKP